MRVIIEERDGSSYAYKKMNWFKAKDNRLIISYEDAEGENHIETCDLPDKLVFEW